jgi:formate dehydrogenase subunit beta
MNVNRVLDMDNTDPVASLQDFLFHWWKRIELKGMLAPVVLPDRPGVAPKIIEDPADLVLVNPFVPFMSVNVASLVADFIRDHPKGPLAIMLRPCELRTLVELHKRKRVNFHSVHPGSDSDFIVTIGVDCPGTFSAEEYLHRVEQSSIAAVTLEALAYGEASDSLPSQLRTACQLCDWPAPWAADLTIGTIGVVSHQYLLLIARDELVDSRLALDECSGRIAHESEVIQRETALGNIIQDRLTQKGVLESRGLLRQVDLCNLLAWFARCTLCTDCLDACPIYEGELSSLLGVSRSDQCSRPALIELVAVGRWLASCSGCGMCAEACQQGVPLARLISILSHNIRDEMHYTAGRPEQRLPWKVNHPG